MTAEAKLRALASASAALQAYFGTALFRWFDRQLPQGYIKSGPCVRLMRVSTVRTYAQTGLQNLSQPRVQIDVMDYDPENCRAAAKAVIDWLGTVDFSTDAEFSSPPTTPGNHPNFILNQRAGMDFQLQPPVYVESIDVRLYNLEN